MIEYLILDYEREEEARLLLESIKQYSKFDYTVTFLSNGGKQSYAKKFKEEGLIDKLVLNQVNTGSGGGTVQLFAQCEAEYALYIQVDHILAAELNQEHINAFIDLVENQGYCYVDLAGDQCNGVYSERAQFINTKFYNSIPKSVGGAGPWHDMPWTEEYMQNYIKDNNLKYRSVYFTGEKAKLPIFLNNGKWSNRSNLDGSQWKHRTDTKQLWMIKKPTKKFDYPNLTDEEWKSAFNGDWPDGKIPEKEKPHSFKYWK
jgi:hypothetical protein